MSHGGIKMKFSILHFDNNLSMLVFCENRSCENDALIEKNYYSWSEMIHDGWSFYKATLLDDKKASGINIGLQSENGTLVEAYCPECSSKVHHD